MAACGVFHTEIAYCGEIEAALVVNHLNLAVFRCDFFVIFKGFPFCGVVFHHDDLHIVPAAHSKNGINTAGKVFNMVFIGDYNRNLRIALHLIDCAVAARVLLD